MSRFPLTLSALAVGLATALAAPAALAQEQTRKPSHCIAIADAAPGLSYVQTASFGAPLEDFTVRLSYIAHASFLIEGPEGFTAVTDYTGFLGNTSFFPDVVTMNNAHSTHWTANPDPRIPHVLPGWNTSGPNPVEHYLDLGEVLVRNVPTDVRSGFGTVSAPLGNSIFVFEIAGLCIGHLGHLHHEPNDMQYAALGRLDVVMAPVDGGYTVPQDVMISILRRLRSSVIVPMHWFGDFTLQSFLTGMASEFRVEYRDTNFLEVSLRTLPSEPTVVVLRPAWLRDDDL
ncbi:MBL fold metallo-hydrolase [Dinoroseobacter sp. S375]|uniref:MBL fold metallo-hydrolase n=1 Tax=Dinoroseobacter sp. S375 TaxID=3415136 RepID=UPI003C7E7FCE